MASPPIKVVDSSSSYASYPSSHDGSRSAAVAKLNPPLKVSSGLRQRLFEFYSMVDPSKATPKIVDAIMEAYAGDWLTLDADLRDKYREQFSGLGSPPLLLEVEDNGSRVSAARSASSTSSSVGVFQQEPTCSTCGSHQFVFARRSTSPTRDAPLYQTKSSIKKQPSQSDVNKSNRPVIFKEVPSKQPSVARPGSTSRYSTPMSAPDYHRSVTPINTAEYEKNMWRRASSGSEVEPPQRQQRSEADPFTEREMAAQDLPSRETEQQNTGHSKREHDEEEAPLVASHQEEGPDGWFEPTMIGDSFYRSHHHPKAVDEQPKGTLLPETVREDEEGDFKKEHSKSRTPAGWQEQTSMVSPTTNTALDSAALQQQRLSYYQQRSLPQSMLVQPRSRVEEIPTSSTNNLETMEPILDGPMSLRSSPPRRQPAFLDGSSPASGDSLVNTSGIRRRPAQLAAERSILAGMILPSSSDEVKNHTILTRKVVS